MTLPVTIQDAVRKDWYSVAEVAAQLGRAAFTVREWARKGRISARKRACGRGRYLSWEISGEAVLFYLNHGLLPVPAKNRIA